eukprot:7846222-Pyramimonas_sp.AAC.1
MDTECEEKTLLGFPVGEKLGYCPWLVIASVYYATPSVYVRNSGLEPLGRLLCLHPMYCTVLYLTGGAEAVERLLLHGALVQLRPPPPGAAEPRQVHEHRRGAARGGGPWPPARNQVYVGLPGVYLGLLRVSGRLLGVIGCLLR